MILCLCSLEKWKDGECFIQNDDGYLESRVSAVGYHKLRIKKCKIVLHLIRLGVAQWQYTWENAQYTQ